MDLERDLKKSLPALTVSASSPDRVAYARDLWPRRLIEVRNHQGTEFKPGAICWPETTEQVAELVRFAENEQIPLVPFGAGSGVCGGVAPDARSLIVDLKKMASWKVHPDVPLIDVGPGAMGITLEEDLQRTGWTIGHFPSSILCSTAGGWIAARGAGQCSGLYGKIEDMVVSLECVLGGGEVVRFRRRETGPDMCPLIVGSEGTLGIITRAELRLHKAPAARAFTAFSFPSTQHGWEALRVLFQHGLRPAVSRVYDPIDSRMMKSGSVKPAPKSHVRPSFDPRGQSSRRRKALGAVLKNALKIPRALNFAIQAGEGNFLGGSTLVLVFEGDAEEVREDCNRAESLCKSVEGKPLGEGPARTWFSHRYSVSYRQAPVFRLGAFSDTMEVAAPWSKLGQLYDDVRAALGEHVLVMAHLSHAYPDGCSIYFTFSAATETDEEALRVYDRAWRAALGAAIAAGGTLSHHHGVGRSKAPRLGEELGLGVDLIRRMMNAWDPAGVFNPGNLVPREPFDSSTSPGVVGTTPWVAPYERGGSAEVDEVSLLATFDGGTSLETAESLLNDRNLSLGLDSKAALKGTIADWIARGMPGARDRWEDPVDQTLAGFVAKLQNDETLVVRPCPRRAVGPDLSALFRGAQGRVGRIDRATLSVVRREAPRARALECNVPRDPEISAAEQKAWDTLVRELVGSA